MDGVMGDARATLQPLWRGVVRWTADYEGRSVWVDFAKCEMQEALECQKLF